MHIPDSLEKFPMPLFYLYMLRVLKAKLYFLKLEAGISQEEAFSTCKSFIILFIVSIDVMLNGKSL